VEWHIESLPLTSIIGQEIDAGYIWVESKSFQFFFIYQKVRDKSGIRVKVDEFLLDLKTLDPNWDLFYYYEIGPKILE